MDFSNFIASADMQNLLATVLTLVVLPLILKGFGFLSQKVKNYYIEQIITTIRDCVVYANQTAVDELKKAGTFTEERKIEIFNTVFDKIMSMVSEKAKVVAKKAFGDFETWVKNKIEVIVKEEKTK